MHLHSASEEWHRRPGSFDWDSAQVDSETVQLRLELESTHARLTMSREVKTLRHFMLIIRDNAWQGCMARRPGHQHGPMLLTPLQADARRGAVRRPADDQCAPKHACMRPLALRLGFCCWLWPLPPSSLTLMHFTILFAHTVRLPC